MKKYIGIDNGITGSISIISGEFGSVMLPIPYFTVQDYTKKKQQISRLNRAEFKKILLDNIAGDSCMIVMEHPFWNPLLSPKASKSGVMCFESQIAIIEDLILPYEVIDSKKWQKVLLPEGIKKSPELKKASLDVGIRLFPMLEDEIRKQKDADSLLIAEWARRNNV